MKINPRDVKNEFQLLLAITRRLKCVQLKFHAKLNSDAREKRGGEVCSAKRFERAAARSNLNSSPFFIVAVQHLV